MNNAGAIAASTRAAPVDSRAWTSRRESRIRSSRRWISIRDSNSPSAGVGTAARSTASSTTARNPSPQSRREVVQAASAASSQAYSRSSSMIQLTRYTAGWKKKTACVKRWAMTTHRSPRRTWASSWSRTQVNCLGVRPSQRSGGITTEGRSSPPTAGEGSRGWTAHRTEQPSPTARRRASRSIGTHPGRSGSASRSSRWVASVIRRKRSSSNEAPRAQAIIIIAAADGIRRGPGRADGPAVGDVTRRGCAAPTAAGPAITTGRRVRGRPGQVRIEIAGRRRCRRRRRGRRHRRGRALALRRGHRDLGVRRPPGQRQGHRDDQLEQDQAE